MCRKRMIAILTAAALLTGTVTSGFVYAESSSSKLDSVNDQISSAKDKLKEGEKKENARVAQIDALNDQIESRETKIAELEAEIQKTEGEIAAAEEQLAETESQMTEQNDSLGKRLRVMYKNGETSILQILLGSSSISEFLTNLDMVQKIYDNDMDVLEQIQEQHDLIEQKKQELESLKTKQDDQQTEQETEKEELAAEKSDVEALKAEVASDNAAIEAQIDQLNKEADELTAMIRQQQASSNVSSSATSQYTGGQMLWPVPGYYNISSPYGYRIHPILHTKKFHSGLDIPAPTGTPIIAAASGTVIMAQTYGGYGKCVMIDHGGGLVTLYGPNSSLVVSKGQTVTKGQTIAKAGSTGQSTGSHCHFEVRLNGSTTSPLSYVQG